MIKTILIILFSLTLSGVFGQQKYILGISGNSSCAGPSGISFCNKTVVFIGNSITRGVDASPILTNAWVYLFSAARLITPVNMGIDGQTMQSGCVHTFDKTTIPVYNSAIHGALVICLGVNDIGQNDGVHNPITYSSLYRDAVSYAISTKGWPAGIIILLTPFYSLNYNAYVGSCSVTVAATQTLAKQYSDSVLAIGASFGCYTVDIRQKMIDAGLNSSNYNTDGVHPNNSGHAWIANYLITHLGFYWWLIPVVYRRRKQKQYLKQAA